MPKGFDEKGSSVKCSDNCIEGLQRAYYVLVYHPSRGYVHFKRCDYQSEELFNSSIIEYFKANPSLYFNGKNFDQPSLLRRTYAANRVGSFFY
jgi:hypothetical protein